MTIVSEEQYRVLAFIAACNRSSYRPTATQVMLWHNNPEPAEAEYRIVQGTGVGSMGSVVRDYERMVDTMLGSRFQSTITSIRDQLLGKDARRELVKPGETFIGHLVRLTWLEETPGSGEEPGLVLTELGRALLRDRERGATEEDVSVVVLEGQDPLPTQSW